MADGPQDDTMAKRPQEDIMSNIVLNKQAYFLSILACLVGTKQASQV
jgi:hypothetical protein